LLVTVREIGCLRLTVPGFFVVGADGARHTLSGLSDDRFQQIMATFDEAMAAPESSRESLVRSRLGPDAVAVAEVLSLLAHADGNASGVETGAGFKLAEQAVDERGALQSGYHADKGLAPVPILSGAYRILRTLGEGGMGVVFEAEQTSPRRRVALKAIRPGFASAKMLRRFQNEVQALARLAHPGIAQIYEAGLAEESSPDRAYFAMELVDGRPLVRFATEMQLSFSDRLRLILKVCDAVQHAHQRGVIHRDLKPANILVTREGQPKVVDFGIARATADVELEQPATATLVGQVIGTPSYMSPEQMRGEDVDTRTDVFALGVIAYEMLAGRLPLEVAHLPLTQAIKAVCEVNPPPLSAHRRELKGDIEVVVAKAMAKEPQRRYLSVGQFADDLRSVLSGEAVLARRDSALYLLRKSVKRHRTLASVAIIILISLVAFSIYAGVTAGTQRELASRALAARFQAESALAAASAARSAAEVAQREADLAADGLKAQLVETNIERGRLEGAVGNVATAEEVLWGQYHSDKSSLGAYWALWELYDRVGSRWIQRTPPPTIAASGARGKSILTMRAGGVIAAFDVKNGKELFNAIVLPKDPPTCLAAFPNGAAAIVGTASGALFRVGLKAEAEPALFVQMQAHSGGTRCISISPDGKYVASGGSDNYIRMWDGVTGIELARYKLKDTPLAVAFSPDGDLLVAGSNLRASAEQIVILSGRDLKLIAEMEGLHGAAIASLAFNAAGTRLYSGSRGGTLVITDIGADAARRGGEAFTSTPAQAIGGGILSIAPTTDGKQILLTSSDRVFILRTEDGTVIRQLSKESRLLLWAGWASADEAALLTDDGTMRRVSVKPGVTSRRISGFTSWCFATCYSPDGALIATGTGGSAIDFFDAATLARKANYTLDGFRYRTRGLVFLGDSRTVYAVCFDGVVRSIDATTGRELTAMQAGRAELFSVAVTPDEQRVAAGSADRRVRIFDTRSCLQTLEVADFDKRIEGMAFSPEGDTLAVAGNVSGVALLDPMDGTRTGFLATTSSPWAVAFSPDAKQISVTTHNGLLEIFDRASGTRVSSIRLHQRLAPGLSYSPDGTMVATGGEDGIVRVVDLATQRSVLTLDPMGHVIVSVSFSPDSKRLLVGTALFFAIEYDLERGRDAVRLHYSYYEPNAVTAPAPK